MSASHPCTLLIVVIAIGTLIQLMLVGFVLIKARERQRRLEVRLPPNDEEDCERLLQEGDRRSMDSMEKSERYTDQDAGSTSGT